VKHHKAYYFSV